MKMRSHMHSIAQLLKKRQSSVIKGGTAVAAGKKITFQITKINCYCDPFYHLA